MIDSHVNFDLCCVCQQSLKFYGSIQVDQLPFACYFKVDHPSSIQKGAMLYVPGTTQFSISNMSGKSH